MKIIRFIKSLFRRRAGKYEVWDTSALSNYFEDFKQKLQQDNITIVIPEGVSHEISVGKKNNDNCKEIYKFLEGNIRNPRLILAVTPDKIRSWEVDEQVIYTANMYYDMGYDTVLVTCDRDQSFRAKLKKLAVNLMPVVKAKTEETNTNTENLASNTEHVPVVVPVEPIAPKEEKQDDEEIKLAAKIVGKQCLLKFDRKISVYDSKGKRKIPRTEGVAVSLNDMVYYNNTAYIISKIQTNLVIAKKA